MAFSRFGRAAVRMLDVLQSSAALRSATRIGAGIRIYGWPRIANEGELVLGPGVVFVSRPSPVELLISAGGQLFVGERALVESGATLRVSGRVSVGRGVRIGPGCILDDGGPEMGGITIGDEAWIEDGAVLLGGASVAPGAIVSAGPHGHSRSTHPLPPSPATREQPPLADVDRRVRAVIGRIVAGASLIDHGADLTHVPGWDSIAALCALVALEKEFGTVLPQRLFAQQPSLASVTPVIIASVHQRGETK